MRMDDGNETPRGCFLGRRERQENRFRTSETEGSLIGDWLKRRNSHL